jgi:hypothetical protein
MTETPRAATATALIRLLREAFEGSPGPWTYFTETGPGAGVMGTIAALSAADVSQASGAGRTTIAGHLQHLSESLSLTARELRGETVSRDRSRSWTVSSVDEAAWRALRERLRSVCADTVDAVERHGDWDEDALAAAIGAIAHTAYHLGSIRQRLSAQSPVPGGGGSQGQDPVRKIGS